MKTFQCISEFEISVEELFRFHEEPIGFNTLVGSSPGVEVIQAPTSLAVGEIAILKIPIIPGLKTRWTARHTIYKENEMFQDVQDEGPFRTFQHSHIFKQSPSNSNHSILEDRIEFEAFMPFASNHIVPIFLKMQFSNRHKITAKALNCNYSKIFIGVK
ncbi:MAG: hypothetical protein JJT78_00370 [Leptospira sp.]|nr:hypothetical protein [Leptospira sp.]